MYYASLSKQAEKFIKKAEKELAKRLIDKIEKLETEPVPQDVQGILRCDRLLLPAHRRPPSGTGIVVVAEIRNY